MKPPFNKDSLSPEEHPIAYLLILCDELQEWNRTPYGILDKKRNLAEEASLLITENRLEVTYLDKDTPLPEQFSIDKAATLSKLLDMDALFRDGFSVKCEMRNTLLSTAGLIDQEDDIAPRQLLGNLEKLAVVIHDLYNQRQLELYPDKPLAHPNFSDLPDSLKYSNLRQARGIEKKLDLIGWEIRPEESAGDVINEIPDEVVEFLAEFEHDEWIHERLGYGWTFGDIKDVENKVSPHLVPYSQLSEEIKDLDRDTIRNIPVLLGKIGMAVYVQEKSPPSRPIITRRLPESYKD